MRSPKSGSSGTYLRTSSSNESFPCWGEEDNRGSRKLLGHRSDVEYGRGRDWHVFTQIGHAVQVAQKKNIRQCYGWSAWAERS
jgi:hypothetical protein